ncbi:hypothetical protein F7725_015378, partial [Dissostichus mawsoni]
MERRGGRREGVALCTPAPPLPPPQTPFGRGPPACQHPLQPACLSPAPPRLTERTLLTKTSTKIEMKDYLCTRPKTTPAFLMKTKSRVVSLYQRVRQQRPTTGGKVQPRFCLSCGSKEGQELQKVLLEQIDFRRRLEQEFHALKGTSPFPVFHNFQDQMKRELAYREEMVQQLQM